MGADGKIQPVSCCRVTYTRHIRRHSGFGEPIAAAAKADAHLHVVKLLDFKTAPFQYPRVELLSWRPSIITRDQVSWLADWRMSINGVSTAESWRESFAGVRYRASKSSGRLPVIYTPPYISRVTSRTISMKRNPMRPHTCSR